MMTVKAFATAEDVRELMEAYLPAAALRAALELGLFWRLIDGPKPIGELADLWKIPLRRCHIWMELLTSLDLLKRHACTYGLSEFARTQIIETYSHATWQLLAQEARERDLAGHDLVSHLCYPGSVWEAQGKATPDYVAHMVEDPDQAWRFTRMFHEVGHRLAGELAQTIDLRGVRRLLDLGGGSGVVSLALLQRNPQLTAVVLDLANVCAAGRKLTSGSPGAERLSYYPADFMQDPLPKDFSVVIECKVGRYDPSLLRKIAGVLHPEGRFIVVDELIDVEGDGDVSRLTYALLNSLQDPNFFLPTTEAVWQRILTSGFRKVAERRLPGGETVLEARLVD